MSDTSPVTAESTTVPAPCECIQTADSFLSKRNTGLVVDIFPDGSRPDSISLSTQLIVRKRGARPMRILANYCPLCGQRYQREVQP